MFNCFARRAKYINTSLSTLNCNIITIIINTCLSINIITWVVLGHLKCNAYTHKLTITIIKLSSTLNINCSLYILFTTKSDSLKSIYRNTVLAKIQTHKGKERKKKYIYIYMSWLKIHYGIWMTKSNLLYFIGLFYE